MIQFRIVYSLSDSDRHQGNLICRSQPGEWTELAIVLPKNIRASKNDR
ncbi:MAG: hypothetical protein U7126_20160 [Microcoleus sp.]